MKKNYFVMLIIWVGLFSHNIWAYTLEATYLKKVILTEKSYINIYGKILSLHSFINEYNCKSESNELVTAFKTKLHFVYENPFKCLYGDKILLTENQIKLGGLGKRYVAFKFRSKDYLLTIETLSDVKGVELCKFMETILNKTGFESVKCLE